MVRAILGGMRRFVLSLSCSVALLAAAACGDEVGSGGSGGVTTGTASGSPDASSSGAPTTSNGTGTSTGAGGGASGSFWHLEEPGDSVRTWLVSPAGERTFLLGANTTMREKYCDGMLDYIRRVPPTDAANIEWARVSDGESGGHVVDDPFCFNSVGAFSDINDFDDTGGDSYMIRPPEQGGAGAPYSVVLNVGPKGNDRALKDESGVVLESGVAGVSIGDPFNPAFAADIDALAASDVAPRKDDPRLVMWFAGNEIGIFDRAGKGEGVRDFRRWIWSDCPQGSTAEAPACAPHALAAFLKERYTTLAALNASWASSYPGDDFATIVDVGPRPVPYVHDCSQACREDLQRFVHDRLLRAWVDVVSTRIRAADPNHLLSSPRLALGDSAAFRFWTPASEPGSDVWFDDPTVAVPTNAGDVRYDPLDLLARTGAVGFDLVSVNVYTAEPEFESPWFTDGVHKLQAGVDGPLYVSEFSVRARIDGWTNKGGAGSFVPNDDATDDQIQRGARYRTQLEQFISFRGVVGASWHAWSDRYASADPAHQIDMGLVQCDDPVRGFEAGKRWAELTQRVSEINCALNDHIAASTGL